MQPPLISVIIPAYNCEQFIAKALQSILNQTYSNFEIVVVDDCSSDGTKDIVRSFGEQVKLIQHDVNRNAAAARNTAITNCRGELIAFLDGDDYWHHKKLEFFVDAFETYPNVNFVFSNFNKFDLTLGKYEALSNSLVYSNIYTIFRNQYRGEKEYFFIPRREMFDLLLKGYPMFPSSIVIQRKLLDLVGGWAEAFRTNEDFDFSLRCARVTDFLYIDQSLTTVVRHAANTSWDIVKHQEKDITVIEAHLKDGSYNHDEQKLLEYNHGRRLCMAGYSYWQSNQSCKARSLYRAALKNRAWFSHALIRWVGSFIKMP